MTSFIRCPQCGKTYQDNEIHRCEQRSFAAEKAVKADEPKGNRPTNPDPSSN